MHSLHPDAAKICAINSSGVKVGENGNAQVQVPKNSS